MGSKEDLVLIDTNIFVIDLRYKRDIHYEINRTFLTYIAKKEKGIYHHYQPVRDLWNTVI